MSFALCVYCGEIPKKQREKYIKEQVGETFTDSAKAKEFVEQKLEQKKSNLIRKKVRLDRKVNRQQWDYTFFNRGLFNPSLFA